MAYISQSLCCLISSSPCPSKSQSSSFLSTLSTNTLAPEDVEPAPANNRLRGWLGICIRNIDEMLNWDLFQRNNLCLLGEFISKIKDGEYRYVYVRRDESLIIPTVK
jgi:hypothetical protein